MARRRDGPKRRARSEDPSALERYNAAIYQPGHGAGWTLDGFTTWLEDRAAYRRESGRDLHGLWSKDRQFLHLNEKHLPRHLVDVEYGPGYTQHLERDLTHG